ncbi:MAG TPA: hypothetical protein PLX74_01980 [Chitinophagaceae bacterium]|nr:hypothetical protein [Chitinophagaceae bacterium]
MAYLTISNSKKIVQKIDLNSLEQIAGEIYEKDIHFFNRRERANLIGIKQLFEDPEKFLEFYKPIVTIDTLQFVFPETVPAFHRDNKCERLNSNFKNYLIPVPIQEKGLQEVQVFRAWFKEMKCAEMEVKQYIESVQRKFIYVGEINEKSIEHKNSGVSSMDNYSMEKLILKIDSLLEEFNRYFHSNPIIRDILYRYQKWTFLAFRDKPIENNFTGISDSQLKDLLRLVEEKWKRPVKDLLIEYYRIKFNPDLEFTGQILGKLGLRACSKCLS